MAGGGLIPRAIVLTLGAGALGGPDALRLLVQFAGRSPAVDLAICVVVISLVTAPLLGTILLARFVRKARAGGGAPAPDLFAQVTVTVSVGAAVLVTACLVFVPGGLGAIRLPVDFAVKNPILVSVLVVCAAAAATGSLPCAMLPRFFRRAGGFGGAAPAAPATTIKVVAFLVAMSSLVASFVASGGFDAHAQLLPGFHWRRRMVVTLPVGVAIVTVAGTTLLVRCSRRARDAAGAAAGQAETPVASPSSPSPVSLSPSLGA